MRFPDSFASHPRPSMNPVLCASPLSTYLGIKSVETRQHLVCKVLAKGRGVVAAAQPLGSSSQSASRYLRYC